MNKNLIIMNLALNERKVNDTKLSAINSGFNTIFIIDTEADFYTSLDAKIDEFPAEGNVAIVDTRLANMKELLKQLASIQKTTFFANKDKDGDLYVEEEKYKFLNTVLLSGEDLKAYKENDITFEDFIETIDIEVLPWEEREEVNNPLDEKYAKELVDKLLRNKFIDKSTAKKFIEDKMYLEFNKEESVGELLSGFYIYMVDSHMLSMPFLMINKPQPEALYAEINEKDAEIFKQAIINRYETAQKEEEFVELTENELSGAMKMFCYLSIFGLFALCFTYNNPLIVIPATYLIAIAMKKVSEG